MKCSSIPTSHSHLNTCPRSPQRCFWWPLWCGISLGPSSMPFNTPSSQAWHLWESTAHLSSLSINLHKHEHIIVVFCTWVWVTMKTEGQKDNKTGRCSQSAAVEMPQGAVTSVSKLSLACSMWTGHPSTHTPHLSPWGFLLTFYISRRKRTLWTLPCLSGIFKDQNQGEKWPASKHACGDREFPGPSVESKPFGNNTTFCQMTVSFLLCINHWYSTQKELFLFPPKKGYRFRCYYYKNKCATIESCVPSHSSPVSILRVIVQTASQGSVRIWVLVAGQTWAKPE